MEEEGRLGRKGREPSLEERRRRNSGGTMVRKRRVEMRGVLGVGG